LILKKLFIKKTFLKMDLDLYDEFGNYIGPDIDDEESDEGQDFNEYNHQAPKEEEMQEDQEEIPLGNEIVLHEDKKYYPEAAEIYGEEVENMVQDEDTQPLTKPIIEPKKEVKRFTNNEILETRYRTEYLLEMTRQTDLIRNVAVVGHLHHGKTALVDMFAEEAHGLECDRFTDIHVLERDRGTSIKSMPFSVLLESSLHKHHLFNLIDTPGAGNFSDEVTCALRIADGAALVVCCIEGVIQN
jgi:U5 small nuclear ribonucleoprotein component